MGSKYEKFRQHLKTVPAEATIVLYKSKCSLAPLKQGTRVWSRHMHRKMPAFYGTYSIAVIRKNAVSGILSDPQSQKRTLLRHDYIIIYLCSFVSTRGHFMNAAFISLLTSYIRRGAYFKISVSRMGMLKDASQFRHCFDIKITIRLKWLLLKYNLPTDSFPTILRETWVKRQTKRKPKLWYSKSRCITAAMLTVPS